jgi:predicted secreted Zn-dependent protease
MLLFEPIHQKSRCRFVVGGVEAAAVVLTCARELERQIRPVHADAIHRSMKASIQGFTKLVLREFDAR